MTFQEFSARYASTADLGFEEPELRFQDTKNRQHSVHDPDGRLAKQFSDRIAAHAAAGIKLYQEMLEAGVAKECARAILPENMRTRLYMTASVRTWIHYLQLRGGNGTQEEHQRVVRVCRPLFSLCFPTVAKACGW